ncbi:hypothetical protein, partial [Belliella aquatica]
ETSKLHFKNEVLTLSVKLPDEPKKLVYLKVTEKELLVSCNFDTDQNYLSRYAYFTLLKHMNYEDKACFKKFYWPNFFDQMTGSSKYFKITNDRRGFDIELRPKYPTFYKPGDDLLILQTKLQTQEAKTYNKISLDDLPDTDYAIGFCLADTHLSSYHSNHYPFLVPFHGLLSKDRERIKNFTCFHLSETDSNELILSQTQKELSRICFKMRELAPLSNSDWQDIFVANEEELENGKQLFKLWQQAYELILSQKHTYFFHTRGLRNVNGKPSRSWMRPCEFKKETPHLVIKRIDKGEYYKIELRFKINGKLNIPQYPNLAFFIRPKTNWLKKYLLGSFDDYLVSSFFARTQYKMAVLKPHYKGAFEDFMNSLAERYEIIEA